MKKLKLHGFNNLTKSLSFCIYDICYAKTAEERDGYIAEWGAMVAVGRNYVLDQWWYCAFPGAAILITAVGFNLFGDGIRDLLDPKSGGKQ